MRDVVSAWVTRVHALYHPSNTELPGLLTFIVRPDTTRQGGGAVPPGYRFQRLRSGMTGNLRPLRLDALIS